jgi:competence ComEA-like helix-hairpin-helix protein
MKFTRLQMILMASGIVTVLPALWIFITGRPADLVETPVPVIERISADYTYTPIVKTEAVKDMFGNTVTSFSSSGRIRVNLNTSNIDELIRLPGVGPVTALRILEYRYVHGPFLRVSDLDNIKGIGPKTIARLSDQAYLGQPDPLDGDTIENLKKAADDGKKSENSVTIISGPCGPGRININTATEKELQALPRIGPKIARRIVDDRTANGPFRDAADIMRVKGIGPKTLERMIDRICAE